MTKDKICVLKTVLDKRYHKLGPGYRRLVFKKACVGEEIWYWDWDEIYHARIVALVQPEYGEDQWALLDNGMRISPHAIAGGC